MKCVRNVKYLVFRYHLAITRRAPSRQIFFDPLPDPSTAGYDAQAYHEGGMIATYMGTQQFNQLDESKLVVRVKRLRWPKREKAS